MNDLPPFHALQAFRTGVYQRLGARRDALFEALDAATTVGPVPSLPYLSLAALHRRGWGSLYAALAEGRLDVSALRTLVSRHPLDDGQPVYALDTSIWPRNDAETSPERGYYYSAARQSAGQPIVVGWSYAWLAQVSFTHDSWTAPLDVCRVPPHANAHTVAAAQIRRLLERQPADSAVPLCVFDAGYDPETLARELGALDGTRVAVLVRLRRGGCFYADPQRRGARQGGRPPPQGGEVSCGDEGGWGGPRAGHPEEAAPNGMGRSSAATTKGVGGRRARSTRRSTRSTGRCGCELGPACTPRATTTPTRAVGRRAPSSAERWCWSRSNGCRARPGFPSASGCGGAAPGRRR